MTGEPTIVRVVCDQGHDRHVRFGAPSDLPLACPACGRDMVETRRFTVAELDELRDRMIRQEPAPPEVVERLRRRIETGDWS